MLDGDWNEKLQKKSSLINLGEAFLPFYQIASSLVILKGFSTKPKAATFTRGCAFFYFKLWACPWLVAIRKDLL